MRKIITCIVAAIEQAQMTNTCIIIDDENMKHILKQQHTKITLEIIDKYTDLGDPLGTQIIIYYH